MGSLWLSLGIKETVTSELKRIQKDLRGTDEGAKAAKKEIKELLASLKSADTPDKLVQSIERINNVLTKSEIGAKDLASALSKISVKDWSLFDEKLTLKNINQVRDAITRMMASLSSSSSKSEEGLAQFFKLGNAMNLITTIQSADKNLKSLRETAKNMTGNALLPDAYSLAKSLEDVRKRLIEAFNTGNIKGSPVLDEYRKVISEILGLYDKINAQKGEQSLFKNVESGATKATDALKQTEQQAKKTEEAIEKAANATKKPAVMKESFQEDAFSKAVDKIVAKTGDIKTATAQAELALNEMLNAFRGSGSRMIGVGDAGEKGRAYVDILNQINAAIEKIRKNDYGGDKDAKEFADRANKALEYLKLLHRIDLAQTKIEGTKASNPNIDSSKIKEALGLITHFREQLTALESSQFLTGVDKANVLKMYSDVWKMTLDQVQSITSKFEKKNPLSDFDNNFTKLDAKIDAFREKLSKLRDLMSEGTSKGFNTSMLTDRIIGLNGVITRMENAMGNQKQLSDGALMKQLFSDMAVEMGKATTATRTYGREKGKVIAQEKEFAAASKLSAKDNEAELKALSDYAKRYMALQEAKRKAEKQRQTEIKNTERRYDSLGNKVRQLRSEFSRGISIGADVNKTEAEIHRLISIMRQLQNLKDNLSSPIGWKGYLGQLGNIGSGHDTTLASRVLQDQRAVNSEVQRGVELEQKRQQEIAQSAARARNDLAAAFAGANAEAKKMQSIVGDIKSLFLQGGIVFGAQQFFNSIVQTGGEIVQQHVALRSILGDVQKADELFAQTQQLALQSPFKFGELNRDVKQLAAFGVEANDLYDTTKRLADIASGLGVSFERLGLAYGQVKARSWLDGKELRQFAYAGLPLLQRITELYNSEGKNGRNNYTQADVKKMITARQVSFEDVQKVLWKMTDEGGQFYNMQFVLSETLLGRWNKLIDAWDIMLGKFAEGKNIVGGTFSFIINRVTDLVLALDKLSPAILSFGAVFAARKLGGMAYSNIDIGSLAKSYTQQMNAQLKSYAIEQQKLVVEGEITQKIAQQNVFKRAAILSEKQSLVASYNRAALEGKMSVLQMQRAVKEGLVSKEIIRQLALMGQITAKQEQIILNGGRMSAVWSMTTSKVGGFINAIGGWWGIGITAITSLLMGYSQWSSRVNEEEKTLIDGAKQKSKSYGDFLSGLGPKDASNLSSQVDSMKEILKSSDDYTDSIKQQVESAGSLSKQYDILKEKIEDAKKANDGLADKYGVITNNATSATGLVSDNLFDMIGADTPQWLQWLNGLTNDDIAKNVEQAQESLSKFQVMFDELDSSTKAKMEDFIRSLIENNEELANQIKGLPLTEQIRMLAAIGGDDWEKFVDKFASGSKETENWLKELAERAKDSSDDVSEIMYDDVPRGLESIRKQLGLSQDQFRTWAKRNPEIFASMMDKMAQKANITSKTILYYFHSAISKLMDMDFWPGDSGNGKQGKPSYNSGVNTPFSEIIRQRLHKNGTFTGNKKKGKFWTREVDNALRQVQDQSFETTGENIRKELKAARNELDTIVNGKVSKNSSEYKNAKHKYDLWKAIANAGYISDDLGKNKVTGNFGKDKNKNGRQEDAELKRLQERLSSLKSARQMYQKYKSIMPDEEAKKKTYNLFPEVTGLNLDDYQKAVHSLLEGFSINTTERKKFQTSIYREVAEWLFDEKDKKEYERKAADFTELLNRLSSQWDLYKELLSKTGDKNFSSAAFSNPGYIDDKAKELIVEYNNKFGKDFQRENAMSMTEGVAKETLKGPGEYEAWKKIVDLLRNNYIKILQDAANIIEKTEDYEDKILKIRERYNELISKTNNPGIKARYEIQRDKEIGQVKLDKFKNSSDYLNFYGAIVSLGMDKAQAIGARIRQNINEALQSGAIDAREYAKEIKQLDEQLSKLTSPKKTFLNGGLKGMAEQKISDASEQMTLAASKIAEGKKIRELGLKMGDENFIKRGDNMIASGKAMMKASEILFKDGTKAKESLDKFANVVSIIDQNVQGMFEAFNDIKETASLLGVDTESDGWQDASAFFETFSGMSSSLSKVVTSAESGNVGGILAGVTGIFTSPIKAFAKAHDAKLDRQIKLAERQLNELKNLSSNINSVIEKTLGGIYSYERSADTTKKLNDVKNDYKAWDAFSKTDIGQAFFGGKNRSHYSKETYDAVMDTESNPSAYADQLALLHAQEDELRKQRQAEEDKKKTDKDKLADYDQQIKEMELQIKTFAQDFLKDVYSIDMKSWASTLTDTIVSAWAKGEDAVDAYREKVKDMVRDVTKNIVSQKIMEKALEKPLEWLTGILDEKGKLDETDMDDFADKLYEVGENVVPQLTGIFDALKNKGLDLRENGSSSTTNSIKGITEETADLLASYLNSIRLYCAEDNANLKQLTELTKSALPEISVIARSQLTSINQLVTLAEYRNGRLDEMYSWMRSITKETGARSIRIN